MTSVESPTGWRRYLPIADWLPGYDWGGSLRFDLIAALTVWALLVPEAMAYASLAGMPAETGFYASLVAPLAYAVFGTSRQINVGPSSSVAVLSLAVVAPLAGGDADLTIQLTVALAILVGVIFILSGIARLGFIADFMSKPVLDGFIMGIALVIAAGQLHKLFGIESTGEFVDNFFGDIAEVITHLDETNVPTLIIGVGSLALLFIIGRVAPQIPAALIVTFLAIIVVSVFDLEDEGVHVIGEISAGLPSLGWPDIGLDAWIDLIPGAIGVVIVIFAGTIGTARTYADKHKYKVDANQEMIALGASNAFAGLAGGFSVDTSISRTAAGDQAGQKSQFASIALSGAVVITILFLTGLFENLPEATLAAIVIHAVWHLIDFNKIARYWNIRRDDFWAAFVALVGVLLFDILIGLALAVGLSLLLIIARISRPHWSVLGRTVDTESGEVAYQSLDTQPDASTIPGLVIIRFEADLFFANADVFADDVRTAIREADTPPRVILIDAESINDIDTTALDMVSKLTVDLRSEGIEMWVARLKTSVAAITERAPDYEAPTTFPSVRAAVQAFQELPEDAPASPDDEAQYDDPSG